MISVGPREGLGLLFLPMRRRLNMILAKSKDLDGCMSL